MVERIGDDGVLVGEEWLKQATVGIETSRIEDSVLGAEEVGDGLFELLMGVLRTADEAHRCHTIATSIHAVFGRLDKFGVVCEAKVVIGAEVDDVLATFYLNGRGLRRDNHAFVFIQTCLTNIVEDTLQVFLKIVVHILCSFYSRYMCHRHVTCL